MKSKIKNFLIYIACLTILSCSNSNHKREITNKTDRSLSVEYLGNYNGIQPSYNLKNQYGDDMIINGKIITVPSSDFKFLIKENSVVTLQQINLEDNSRIYYSGTYKIISDSSTTINIACEITDGKNSNPKYYLNINKVNKSGTCIAQNESDFNFKKIK
jgi:hypothetical protein